jgi:hypothetical protein
MPSSWATKVAAGGLTILMGGTVIFANWPFSDRTWFWLGFAALAFYAIILLTVYVVKAIEGYKEILALVSQVEKRIKCLEDGTRRLEAVIDELKSSIAGVKTILEDLPADTVLSIRPHRMRSGR